ncbi:MAG TPA: phosphopantetheine-binding protein [Candidatus Paceibacterota bacterium]|nr:phosphopantetheine-binding protein [Candidatus Paceibacterota bacterium]HPS18429.1 phosphopantetheine-binding protein [Bacteroidales bacterium]
MNQEQIKAKLTDILSYQLGVDKTSITSETTMSDLGADYLEQAEILIEIEKEFGLEFQDYVKMGVESFENLCLYVEKALQQKENN